MYLNIFQDIGNALNDFKDGVLGFFNTISDIIGSSDGFDYQTFAPIAAKNATDLVNYIIKEIK